jgi:hypothetical protein
MPLGIIRREPNEKLMPARFWFNVAPGRTDDECWPWEGTIESHGYGRIKLHSRGHMVHRVAYELEVGPIPDGLTVDHECHNVDPTCSGGPTCLHRRCVNPAHLVARTTAENTLRSPTNTATINGLKTHCLRGHPFEGDNLYIVPSTGQRACRTCHRGWHQDWKARHRVTMLG